MAVAGAQSGKQADVQQGFLNTESGTRTAVLCALIFAATIVVYFPVHNCSFFDADDYSYVVNSRHVRQGLTWGTITWAFTTLQKGNWIPLSFVSHAIDYQLFGENPAGHHVVNMLLHALNAALLFWLLKRATGYVGRSFMVAALFAVHPINVEAVAWIAERKTVLSMVFFLLAMAAYPWYVRQPKDSRYRVVACLFALGLMAKSQIITLPCVFLLWDFWPLQRMSLGQPLSPEAKLPPLPEKPFVWLVKEKVTFLLIAAAAAMLTIYSEGGTRPGTWPPLSHRFGNAVFSYVRYLALTFWPSNMVPLYPNRGASLTFLQVSGCLLLLIVITALVLMGRRHRYLPVGWFLFLGTLVPTINLLQFGLEGMADRFAYQAVIGLFIIVCWGVSDWVASRNISRNWLVASGAVVLLALAIVTQHQIAYWKTPNTMWAHALATTPGHWFAERQVGQELLAAGKREEALQHFRRALQNAPNDTVSNLSVGIYDQQHGNPQQAIVEYKNALKDAGMEPGDAASIYHNMGVAYRDMGDTAAAQECFDKAQEQRKRPRQEDAN